MGKLSKYILFSFLLHVFLVVLFFIFSASFFSSSDINPLSSSSLQVFQMGEEASLVPKTEKKIQKNISSATKLSLKNDAAIKSSSTSNQNAVTTSSGESSAEPSLKSGSGTLGAGAHSNVLSIIRKKIERAKRYPEAAQLRAQEGVVFIRLKLALSGNIESLSLSKSSGYKILDEEALATVRRAAPFPYYEDFVETSLRFKLED